MKMLRVDVDPEVGEMGRGLGKAVPKPIPFEKPKRQPEGLPKGVVVNEKGQWGYDPGKVPQQGAMASSAALEEALEEAPEASPVVPFAVGDWVRRKVEFPSLETGLQLGESARIVLLEDCFAHVECKKEIGLSSQTWPCSLRSIELSPWQFSESPE